MHTGTKYVYRSRLGVTEFDRELRRFRAALRLARRQLTAIRERAGEGSGRGPCLRFRCSPACCWRMNSLLAMLRKDISGTCQRGMGGKSGGRSPRYHVFGDRGRLFARTRVRH